MEKIHQQAHDGPIIIWPEKFLPPEVAEEVRLVPLERTKGKPLYVDKYGRGYSCHVSKNNETGESVFILNCIKDIKNGEYRNILCYTGKEYRMFRDFGHILVHHAVLLAWVGPCPEGYQCDHLNGNNVDNRLCNLQWVTPSENQRRARTLRRLRKLHEEIPILYKDPTQMTRKELLHLFSQE